jgi:hypothetical protein
LRNIITKLHFTESGEPSPQLHPPKTKRMADHHPFDHLH